MSITDQALFIRQQSELWLTDSCVIRSHNGYAAVDGEYTESFTDSSPVPCRIINKSAKINADYSSQDDSLQLITNQTNLGFQLPFTTQITTKDKIVYNNVVYDVMDVPVKHSLMGAFIVRVEKRK